MRWSGLRKRASLNRKAPMRSPAPVATWDQNHKDSRLNSSTDTHRGSHHFEGQQMSCTVHFPVDVESKVCSVVVLSLRSRPPNINATYAACANTFLSSPLSFSNFCNVACAFPIFSIKYFARIPVTLVRLHQRAESNPIIRNTCNSCSHASTVASALSMSFTLKARS